MSQKNLWKKLKEFASKNDNVNDLLVDVKRIVKDATPILNVSAQAAPQFTLHDAGHARRVVKRMADIIPDYTFEQLAPLECAMLILSAYLHDIGMSPPRNELVLYENLLFDNRTEGSSENKLDDFRDYLATQWRVTKLPLHEDRREHPRPWFVEQIITDWVRINHVKKGWEIVRSHMDKRNNWRLSYLGTDYSSWLNRVCESHEQDFEKLADSSRFGIEELGSQGETCNLRYLAMVLRTADIIEFDRERVPEVLYQHQYINNWQSVSEWNKHLDIQSYQVKEKALHLTAHPSRAVYFAAIRHMVRCIEEQIQGCGRLAREYGINPPNTGKEEGKYVWELYDTVHHRITEPPNTYIFIEGAFIPDTEQILRLFTGTEMYSGDPWVSLREVMQNSFDAIREKQARKRLARSMEGRNWREINLDEDYVQLAVETHGDDIYLVCKDTGVGMEKQHFEDYILRTGRSSTDSREIARLRRQCKAAGVPFERTSKFGVGILSYFMITNKVTFITRRDQCCQSIEPQGWTFTTEGVGSFGELKKMPGAMPGTTVELRIAKRHWQDLAYPGQPKNRPEILDAEQAVRLISEELVKAFRRYFIYIPCPLTIVTGTGCSKNSVVFRRGWVQTSEDVKDGIIHQIDRYLPDRSQMIPEKLMSKEERSAKRMGTVSREKLRRIMIDALNVFEYSQEKSKQELWAEYGIRIRVMLPYFRLPQGICLAFLSSAAQSEILRPLPDPPTAFNVETFAWVPALGSILTYHGLAMKSSTVIPLGFSVRSRIRVPILAIDILSEDLGRIAVDRFSVNTTKKFAEVINSVLKEAITEAYQDLVKSQDKGTFRTLSDSIAQELYHDIPLDIPPDKSPSWIIQQWDEDHSSAVWRTVSNSVIVQDRTLPASETNCNVLINGNPVDVIKPVSLITDYEVYSESLLPSHVALLPQRVVAAAIQEGQNRSISMMPMVIWGNASQCKQDIFIDHIVVPFPANWNHVFRVGVGYQRTGYSLYFNADNPLTKFCLRKIKKREMRSIQDIMSRTSQDLLNPRLFAECFAFSHIWASAFLEHLNRLIRYEPMLLEEAWGNLEDAIGCSLPYIVIGIGQNAFVFSSTESHTLTFSSRQWNHYFPIVDDPDWLVKFKRSDDIEE